MNSEKSNDKKKDKPSSDNREKVPGGIPAAGEAERLKEINSQVQSRSALEKEILPVASEGEERKVDSIFIRQCLDCLDLGDGLLFAHLNRGRFVYNASSGEWMRWSGQHWMTDEKGEIRSAIESTLVKIYLEEMERVSEQISWAIQKKDNSRQGQLEALRKIIIKRIDRLRTTKGREACLEFARTCGEPSLVISGDMIDRKPWLLGCINGTIDLRSGKFRDGDPSDYLCKISPVEWLGFDAKCPRFEEFLFEILDDNNDLYLFVQRLLGYTIIGVVIEHIIVLLYGLGRNGKSTLIEVVKHILGPLCRPIPSEVLLVSKFVKSAAGPSPEIMMLQGLRVAFATETDEGHRFSMNMVKQLSGGDSLTGRNPHDKHLITFQPTHKLFLLTNWRPSANADDFGFWERLVLIDFPLSFVDRNPTAKNERPAKKNLIQELKAEAPGILAWLVRGCLIYQKEGLNPPQVVREAAAAYRQEEDLLGDFIAANCSIGEHFKEQSRNLYDRFVSWYEEEISKKNVPSQRRFSTLMMRRFNRISEKGCRFYQGLELRPTSGA